MPPYGHLPLQAGSQLQQEPSKAMPGPAPEDVPPLPMGPPPPKPPVQFRMGSMGPPPPRLNCAQGINIVKLITLCGAVHDSRSCGTQVLLCHLLVSRLLCMQAGGFLTNADKHAAALQQQCKELLP